MNFVAGITYNGDLKLEPAPTLPQSAELLLELLPRKSEILIYSTAVFGVDITDNAFKSMKEQGLTVQPTNPKEGKVVCKKCDYEIEVALSIGDTCEPINLDREARKALLDKLDIVFSIEEGMSLEDLPKRRIVLNPVEREKEKQNDMKGRW